MITRHFLEKLALKTELMDVGVVIPLDSGGTLSARGIRSVTPLSISTDKGLSSFSMGGELKVDEIKGVPSLRKMKNRLSVKHEIRKITAGFE